MIKYKYDIVFDFSVSKSGGGLRRLHAYMKYFSCKNISVLFIINPASEYLAKELNVKYHIYSRNKISRFLKDKKILKIVKGNVNLFFSYGIPISIKVGNINILHLSNALPFDYENCNITKFDLIKNILLRILFKIYKKQEILTAESEYTINKYIEKIGWNNKTMILKNGFDEPGLINCLNNKYGKYAVTIGTEKYKRLDRAYEVFLKYKKEKKIERLLIIGNTKKIPKNILKNSDVLSLGILSRNEVISLLKNSNMYITTSEIENSSNALIEALIYSRKVILSFIESHLEVFEIRLCKIIIINNSKYLLANYKSIKSDYITSWEESIKLFLNEIHLTI